ncbi:MAG: flagellar protein FlgN [Nitrospiraceae bacterium]|nr:flagellar protein FlgN [Nitrospiraceae bacterium]
MTDEMDENLQKIRDILERQVGEYKDLLKLLQKERLRLMELDGEAVEELSKQKDTVVLKLRLLEQERLRLLEKISAGFGADGLLGLRELAAKTGNVAFQALRGQLICLLQGIAELNEFNRVLVERSLTVVNRSLETLGARGPAVQGRGGRSGSGLVVSRNI